MLADWLEKNGQADRADFIRVQIKMARLPAHERSGSALWLREYTLLTTQAGKWRVALPRLEGVRWGAFERGFVASIEVESAPCLQQHADLIFSTAPIQKLPLLGVQGVQHRGRPSSPASAARR